MKSYIDCDCEAEARDFLKRAGLHTLEIANLKDIGYFVAPASKGHHLACAGGLMRHSINVSKILLGLASYMLDERSCCRIGMLHDLVKCYCYRSVDGEDGRYEYVQPPYPGHGVASVLIALDCGCDLTAKEKTAILWHMGVFGLDDKEMKTYREALRFYGEEMVLTHAADHLASIREEQAEAVKGEVKGVVRDE